jgi:hypothetical protein
LPLAAFEATTYLDFGLRPFEFLWPGDVADALADPMMDPRHETSGFQMPPVPAPPLMNPPPQIFGAYGADGLPLPASLPDMPDPIFTDGILLDESNEAKRRRIARVGCLASWRRR